MTARRRLREVEVQALDAARLEPLIGPDRMKRFEVIAETTRAALAGRAVLNVNSTAVGGGVAEMLQTLLAYVRGAGVDARWLVIKGDPAFFAITKRIHNGLYGAAGDGGPLGEGERRHYEDMLQRNADELLALVRPGDVVLLHDPQPAGLAAAARGAGARVIWRCHVGRDQPNEWTERAWEFLRPYLSETQGRRERARRGIQVRRDRPEDRKRRRTRRLASPAPRSIGVIARSCVSTTLPVGGRGVSSVFARSRFGVCGPGTAATRGSAGRG